MLDAQLNMKIGNAEYTASSYYCGDRIRPWDHNHHNSGIVVSGNGKTAIFHAWGTDDYPLVDTGYGVLVSIQSAAETALKQLEGSLEDYLIRQYGWCGADMLEWAEDYADEEIAAIKALEWYDENLLLDIEYATASGSVVCIA